MPTTEIVKDDAYYMSLDKRSKEYKDWKASQEQKASEVTEESKEAAVEELQAIEETNILQDMGITAAVENPKPTSTLVVGTPMMRVNSNGTIDTAPKGEFNVTYHRFKMNDKVFAVMFGIVKESRGYEQIKNNAKFYVREGEIERVIVTDVVQYKLKNIAGSLLNEDMIYFDKDAAQLRADAENGGLHARGEGR